MIESPVDTLTLERFLRLPEFTPALEFIGGRIIQKMSPKFPHTAIQTELASTLNAFARPRKLGRAFTEFRAVFGGEAVVPDVSFYLPGRVPRDLGDRDILVPPDISVEILSRGQTISELVQKLRFSLNHGSKLGWAIHPIRKKIHILRSGQKARVQGLGDVLSGEDVLPGFSIALEEIFGWLEPE